jgi:hypothetical protein
VRLASLPGRLWSEFERRVSDATRPYMIRWEGLPGQVQVGVTFPIMVVVLFVIHLVAFNLSATRSLFYAVFWAIPATAIVYIATRTEAAKRAQNRPPERRG